MCVCVQVVEIIGYGGQECLYSDDEDVDDDVDDGERGQSNDDDGENLTEEERKVRHPA